MGNKKSAYNIIIPYLDNEIIIFNSFSGALGKFDNDTFLRFNKCDLTLEESNLLLEKGILIEDTVDELNQINKDRDSGINFEKVKIIRIWPTSFCNARCDYCFEKGIQCENMTYKTADAAIKYISDSIKEGDTLRIEWFGGEPLMCIDMIDYYNIALSQICTDKHCRLEQNIITNGSMIDENIAKKMRYQWNINNAQITLDGDRNRYNEIKNYSNRDLYNFDKVLNAIKLLSKNDIKVSVRINYELTNYNSISKLIDCLHDELSENNNIYYYIYPIWNNAKKSSECSSHLSIDRNLLLLFDKLLKYNMVTINNIARLKYKKHACRAWGKNSFSILPSGKISKCCESYNAIIGNVWDGITDNKLYEFWTNPELPNECVSCKYLPLCQGGCKASYFNCMSKCFAFKSIFCDIIKWVVSHKTQTD